MKFDKDAIDRPDFGFFERILGRTIPRPATVAEAHAKIEELLLESFTTKPHDLVRAAGGKQLQTLWSAVGNRPDVKEESLDYVVSRLWERDPSGIPAKARIGGKPKDQTALRNTWVAETATPARDSAEGPKVASTNAIKYYRAAQHGVVVYLRQHIIWILSDFQTELAAQNCFISTDYLLANGVELASHGKFVRQTRVHDPADENHGNASDGLTKRTDRDVRAEMRAHDEDANERDGFADAESTSPESLTRVSEPSGDNEQPESDAEHAQRPKYRALRSYDEIAMRSKNRPDVLLFREELDVEVCMAPDPASREIQLREFARILVNTRCEGMPDKAEVLASVEEWPVMEKPFQAYFVEVIDWLNTHPKELAAGAQEAIKAPEPDPLESVTQLEILSTPLIQEAQNELARTLIDEGRLWRLHSTPEMLASPDRPDYLFLRRRLGYGTPAVAKSDQRMAELKGLGLEFVNALFRGSPALRQQFREEITYWNPEKSLFNEEVAHVISRLVEHDRLSPDDVQSVACSFFSHYREAADPDYVAQLEAAQLKAASGNVQQGYLLEDVAADARRPRRERRAPTPRTTKTPDISLPSI